MRSEIALALSSGENDAIRALISKSTLPSKRTSVCEGCGIEVVFEGVSSSLAKSRQGNTRIKISIMRLTKLSALFHNVSS
jgi:hypothetical protein